MPEERLPLKNHRLELNARKTAAVTGVKEVQSFDEQEVLLETEMGLLIIRGSGLHIDRLTTERGEVDLNGRIDSLIYTEAKDHAKNGENWLKRLLR